jgi:hypothetical protein
MINIVTVWKRERLPDSFEVLKITNFMMQSSSCEVDSCSSNQNLSSLLWN